MHGRSLQNHVATLLRIHSPPPPPQEILDKRKRTEEQRADETTKEQTLTHARTHPPPQTYAHTHTRTHAPNLDVAVPRSFSGRQLMGLQSSAAKWGAPVHPS